MSVLNLFQYILNNTLFKFIAVQILKNIVILRVLLNFFQVFIILYLHFTVERQIAAIVGIRDVQIEHLLIELCMIRSYFDKHQLQTPALQFFEEKFPTMSVVRNGENGEIDVQCNLKYGNVSLNDGRYLCASLLPRLSLAYSDCSAAVQPFGGFDFSSEAGNG